MLFRSDKPAANAPPPAAVKETAKPEEKGKEAVEFTVKDEHGKPLAGWSFDIGTKKGKLDDQGHGKIEGLAKGSYTLRVFQEKADDKPKTPPKIDPPPAEMGDPGVGYASKLRAASIDEALKSLKDNGEHQSKVKDW